MGRTGWLGGLVVAVSALWALASGGCSASSGGESSCTSTIDCDPGLDCVDGRCVSSDASISGCTEDDDCPEGLSCDTASGECFDPDCTPGTTYCEAGVLYECDDRSSSTIGECPSGRCEGERCGCTGDGDCLPGATCAEGACACDSSTYCESPAVCCEEGDICLDTASCDEDGTCRTAERCAPRCDEGVRCGEGGQLCCEGDTPVCGPLNTCVPDCGEQMLCGDGFDTCCEADEVCSFGSCLPLGDECERFTDCDFGEYCEPTLGRCVEDDFPEDIDCRRPGEDRELTPEVRWHWEGVGVDGTVHANVAATPMVADVTGDGSPNVVFPAYRAGGEASAVLVVLDGVSGDAIYHNATHPLRAWGQVALADLEGDGTVEIVVSTESGVGLVESPADCPDPSADPDGCYRFHRTGFGDELGVLVADLRGDGTSQIIFGQTVLDPSDGSTIDSLGTGSRYPSVADVTGDGALEILSLGCAYRLTGAGALEEVWCTPGIAGWAFSATGNIAGGDRAGQPEAVWVGDGRVTVATGDTGEVLEGFDLPGGGEGGPPTVADFDGDGNAEVGVAGSGCYTVFDLDCLGDPTEDAPGCMRPSIAECTPGVDCFDVQACPDLDATSGTGDGILWSVFAQDISSSRTGSSVFDFQGDGRNEVVYNDECLLMVYDGGSGAPVFRVPNTSRTASEYPVIVDVTGDGQTNIVVAANNDQLDRDCTEPFADRPDRYPECHEAAPPAWCAQGTQGVFAYQDTEDRWVRTRAIWNEFDYHIDNVADDGTIPVTPDRSWDTHNTFRANRQGEVPLNASDPRVEELRVFVDDCPERLEIAALISNQGTRAIPAGMPVTLYRMDEDGPVVVDTVVTTEPLFPGGVLVVTFEYALRDEDVGEELAFRVVANDDGSGDGPEIDCNPDLAQRDIEGVSCAGLQ